MPIWKRILIILSISLFYVGLYRIIGFELTIIAALVNIISDLIIKDYPKKVQPPKNMYVKQQQKGKFKF